MAQVDSITKALGETTSPETAWKGTTKQILHFYLYKRE